MGAIVLDVSKVNSYVLPILSKSENTMQDAYNASQSLRNSLPSSFNNRGLVSEIVNQLYSIKKEIKDTKTMISKKVDRAETIETKNDSKVNSLVRSAVAIGALTGAVASSATGSISSVATGAVAGAVAGAIVTTPPSKKKQKSTGAKTVVGKVVSGVKKIFTGIGNFFKNTASKISKGIKSIWQKFSGSIKKIAKGVANVGKKIVKTRAKIVKGVVSGVKKLGSKVLNGIKKVGSKIVSGAKTAAKWVKNTTKKVTSWLSDKFKKVKDWTCKAIKNTGAWISKAAKATWNWITDVNSWKRLGATIVNGFLIAVTKGAVKLVESIVDLGVLLSACKSTIGTALYDVGKGIFTGKWDWSATKGLWDKTKSIVAYDATGKLSNWFYNTSVGKTLDKYAYSPFKSDGMGCKILEGVGYIAGVVVISIFTFGAGGVAIGSTATIAGVSINAGAVAITATAAGIGKYTEQEWNKNSLSISYGNQEIGLTIDYQKYSEIEKLKDGKSTTITQKFTGQDGNPIEMVFIITKNGDTYSVKDSNGNAVGFNGVKESSTIKGLGIGTIKGLGDGLKAYTAVSTLGNVQTFVGAASKVGGGNVLKGTMSIVKDYGAKESMKTIVKTSAKQTFKDTGFYIDSGTHIYTDVKSGIETGDWNLLKTGAKIAGAYGINFLGNLGGNLSNGLINSGKQIEYSSKIGQQLDDIDSQILKAQQLGDYDEITRLQQQKSLLNQEYYATMYGAGNVELTSGIGVEGSNGTIISRTIDVNGKKIKTNLTNSELEKYGKGNLQHGVPEDIKYLKTDIDGKLVVDWSLAPDRGAVPGTRKSATIGAGSQFDRYGNPNGNFVGKMDLDSNGQYQGVSYDARSLPYTEGSQSYTKYTVLKDLNSESLSQAVSDLPKDSELYKVIKAQVKNDGFDFIELPDGSVKLNVTEAKIAAAFGHDGGGIQYEIPVRTNYLKELGFIDF